MPFYNWVDLFQFLAPESMEIKARSFYKLQFFSFAISLPKTQPRDFLALIISFIDSPIINFINLWYSLHLNAFPLKI